MNPFFRVGLFCTLSVAAGCGADGDSDEDGPRVTIYEPAAAAVFAVGDVVHLRGSATDSVDGDITSKTQLTWRAGPDSAGEGPEGSIPGDDAPALPAGEHTISLTAIDSRGLSATAAVTIRVK